MDKLLMSKKYKIYTESGWNTANAKACEKLNIPNEDASTYASMRPVTNPSSADYGKFIFPVITEGKWKCDDLFPSAISWNEEWVDPT